MSSPNYPISEVEVGSAELELSIEPFKIRHGGHVPLKDHTIKTAAAPKDCDNCANSYCCVEMTDICINYGKKTVVKNVSLKIFKNSVTAIIGPSGCGKSSFLCCINKLTDLIPECKVSGCISFDWDDTIYQKKGNLLRKHVGMLFQKPNPFPFSIWKNIAFPLKEHGIVDSYDVATRVEKALSDVGLWNEVKDRLHQSALSLSGGQQQRLCLARALVLEPTVLLMDEPCSALDPMATKKIEELIRELSRRMTVILVTHNLAQARRVSDYVALFWRGEDSATLVEYSLTEEFFSNPKDEITKTYLAYC